MEVERFRAIIEGYMEGKNYSCGDAYADGYGLGYDEGYDEGKKIGNGEGYNEGHRHGYEEGYSKAQEEAKVTYSKGQVLCALLVAFVNLFVVIDLIAAAWSRIREKPYKSSTGNFTEEFVKSPVWLTVLIVIAYLYGLKLWAL